MNRTISAKRVAQELIEEIDEDWEEYNPSKGPFVAHMIAGSIAGLAEHGPAQAVGAGGHAWGEGVGAPPEGLP